jgi:hypothetical protein
MCDLQGCCTMLHTTIVACKQPLLVGMLQALLKNIDKQTSLTL